MEVSVKTMNEVLQDLREAAGHLRRFQRFDEAKHIEIVANKLDLNEIKPAPIVYRTTTEHPIKGAKFIGVEGKFGFDAFPQARATAPATNSCNIS